MFPSVVHVAPVASTFTGLWDAFTTTSAADNSVADIAGSSWADGEERNSAERRSWHRKLLRRPDECRTYDKKPLGLPPLFILTLLYCMFIEFTIV